MDAADTPHSGAPHAQALAAGALPAQAPRTWFVYLIECSDGSLYTGIAVDVARRFRAHVAGKGARYTRSHPPRRLAAVLPCADRGAALRAEIKVKRLTPAAKRALCARHPPASALDS
jgi:putative endonuclease